MIKKPRQLVIIIGVSGGIGAKIAQMSLAKGHEVIGIDKNNYGGTTLSNYTHYTCDVMNFKELKSTIEKVTLRKRNALINCAGIREICSISELSIEKWEEVISVNLSAVFVSSKSFAEKVKAYPQATGSIINIASVSGLLGEPNRTAYVTSKHGVIGLTKQLAIEYGKFNIRANAVAPGVIRTPLTDKAPAIFF